jgi:hypothetical protein
VITEIKREILNCQNPLADFFWLCWYRIAK